MNSYLKNTWTILICLLAMLQSNMNEITAFIYPLNMIMINSFKFYFEENVDFWWFNNVIIWTLTFKGHNTSISNSKYSSIHLLISQSFLIDIPVVSERIISHQLYSHLIFFYYYASIHLHGSFPVKLSN